MSGDAILAVGMTLVLVGLAGVLGEKITGFQGLITWLLILIILRQGRAI